MTIISEIREDYRALKGLALITPASFRNKVIDRNGTLGSDACKILSAAVNAVDPYQCVSKYLDFNGQVILLGEDHISMDEYQRVSIIGFGKAAVPMAKAVLDRFQGQVGFAQVITKDPEFLMEDGYQGKLVVSIGGHPVPNQDTIVATKSLLNALPKFTCKDLVFIVISGGGSALFSSPMGEVSLNELQILTTLLLRSGADIHEINTLRKHIDRVKGGRLASLIAPACVHSLILSDVVGDRLDMIASGPTVADPTTYADAWDVIVKYGLEKEVPESILELVKDGRNGQLPETLKEKDFQILDVHNHLVGTNRIASEAAVREAKRLGYNSHIVSNTLTGLTTEVADQLEPVIKSKLTEMKRRKEPFCLVYGGETTVKVTGNGRGGRNQDLVLHLVPKLADQKNLLLISLATDGEDGPTDAAGAASDAMVFQDGTNAFLDLTTYIITNNAYEYLDTVGALIKTGSTGTNVNDLIVILGKPADP